MPVRADSAAYPPSMPVKFISVVRIGSAITQAITRVTTRYLNESTAVASSASICSVTRIAPSSAPMPAPIRPDSSSAAVSGPVSRTSAMARPAGISASAPNRASDARVCIDSTTPTAKPAAAMSGVERHPSSNNWRSVSLTSNGGRNASLIARPANTPQSPAISSSESSVGPIRPVPSKQFVGEPAANEESVRALVAVHDLSVLKKRHRWTRDHVPGEHVDGEASGGVIPDVDPGSPRKARIHPQREDFARGEIVGLKTIEGIARHHRQVERQAFAGPRVAHAAHDRLDAHASEASGLIAARKQIDSEPIEVDGGRQASPRAESHERPA